MYMYKYIFQCIHKYIHICIYLYTYQIPRLSLYFFPVPPDPTTPPTNPHTHLSTHSPPTYSPTHPPAHLPCSLLPHTHPPIDNINTFLDLLAFSWGLAVEEEDEAAGAAGAVVAAVPTGMGEWGNSWRGRRSRVTLAHLCVCVCMYVSEFVCGWRRGGGGGLRGWGTAGAGVGHASTSRIFFFWG